MREAQVLIRFDVAEVGTPAAEDDFRCDTTLDFQTVGPLIALPIMRWAARQLARRADEMERWQLQSLDAPQQKVNTGKGVEFAWGDRPTASKIEELAEGVHEPPLMQITEKFLIARGWTQGLTGQWTPPSGWSDRPVAKAEEPVAAAIGNLCPCDKCSRDRL